MTHVHVEVVKNIKTAAEEIFKDRDMEKVETYLIQAGSYKAEIINYGAMIKSFYIDDIDVVLGLQDYDTFASERGFLSQVVGPFANRISNAQFEMDGIIYKLENNRGSYNIHSGSRTFGKQFWSAVEKTDSSVTLFLHSPESAGFPGDIDTTLKYTITEDGKLKLHYTMTSNKKTPINITNHVYFTLGEKDSRNIVITLPADSYVATDNEGIPTEITSVDNSEFDLRKPVRVGSLRNGYFDHCFVLNKDAVIKAETDALVLTCKTDLPGVQFYTAGGMNKKEKAKDGSSLVPFSGFALESEYFPNFPNRPDFKGKYLMPGEIYETETVYQLNRK